MKSRRLQIALLCLLAAIAVFAAAEPPPSRSAGAGYAVLRSDLEPFRSEFNAKSDHVRAVLLVSPT